MKTNSSATLARWVRYSACLLAFGVSGLAVAAIANTKHNLGSTQTTGNETNATDEICVFCHTPHAANTNVAAPLWNKALPSGTYTMYSSSTMEASTAGQPGGISLACLSCHDGTQAMDNMINAPGSGGWNSAGARFGGAGNWSGSTQSGGFLNSGVAALGQDLTNDHPIGIAYCGNSTPGTPNGCTDGDFRTATKNANNSGGYVDRSGSTAGRDKTDMWLYYSSGSGFMQVECASCHDPHTGNATFLRTANTGSAVCLACHVK